MIALDEFKIPMPDEARKGLWHPRAGTFDSALFPDRVTDPFILAHKVVGEAHGRTCSTAPTPIYFFAYMERGDPFFFLPCACATT